MKQDTSFWRNIFKRAWHEAREALRLDTPIRVAAGVGAPVAAFLFVARVTGQPAWTGLATLAIILSIGILTIVAKTFSLPPAMFRELERQMKELSGNVEDAERAFRADLLDRLVSYYITTHPDASARIVVGLELPPIAWINAQLFELGEAWNVVGSRGARYWIDNHVDCPIRRRTVGLKPLTPPPS